MVGGVTNWTGTTSFGVTRAMSMGLLGPLGLDSGSARGCCTWGHLARCRSAHGC